jgi:glycosyltransferase involved in cell wall biosynthesis
MRILALVPAVYDTSPCQRYRFEQWAPFLRNLGAQIAFEPFEDDGLHAIFYQRGYYWAKSRFTLQAVVRRISVLKHIREFDVVYVHREAALLGPPIFENWVHRSGVPMVFDFDDAVWLPVSSGPNGKLSLLKCCGLRTRTACRNSAHVMAGNAYLAGFAQQYNRNVTIVPTTIDIAKYTVGKKTQNEVPVIGWTGSFSTVPYLDTIRGALLRLARSRRFRLRVVGTPEYRLEGVDVQASDWRADTEVDDLRVIDIGIMPLPDDAWSRGKCGLKALQYMGLGIPAVVSPVGVNSSIVKDGENGYTATTEDEWVAKLDLLLASPELRQKIGAVGRLTVEQEYSAQVHAPRVFNIFASVVRKSSTSPSGTCAARPV